MAIERRFEGALGEDYRLISLAMPHFQELQAHVGRAVANYPSTRPAGLQVLELGAGSGVTADAILSARPDLHLVSLDSEEKMILQAETNLAGWIQSGRCRLVQAGALEFLREQPADSLDIIASALTLHNMTKAYRDLLQVEVFRTLRPGGTFINADKYAPQDEKARFEALGIALGRFFDAFVPLGKLDLLRDWVLHNLADQGPERVMLADDTLAELARLGFTGLQFKPRWNMEALLIAFKPA